MTAKDLLKYLETLESRNINLNNVEIALGDDEELNGLHYGSYVELVSTKDVKDYKWEDVVNGKIPIEDYSADNIKVQVKELFGKNKKVLMIS